jgi:hypothetical protein
MSDVLGKCVAVSLLVAVFIGFPAVIMLGWARWFRLKEQREASILSFAGFAAGNVSAWLAISMVLYAHEIRGFPHYDPRLIRVDLLGLSFSFIGTVFALLGRVRPNPLRWHAFILSAGMCVFWFLSVLSE